MEPCIDFHAFRQMLHYNTSSGRFLLAWVSIQIGLIFLLESKARILRIDTSRHVHIFHAHGSSRVRKTVRVSSRALAWGHWPPHEKESGSLRKGIPELPRNEVSKILLSCLFHPAIPRYIFADNWPPLASRMRKWAWLLQSYFAPAARILISSRRMNQMLSQPMTLWCRYRDRIPKA